MLRECLAYLHPLELVDARDIAKRFNPARHQVAQRNEVMRQLVQYERGMPPLGDYNGKVWAYRYLAEVAREYPSRPGFPYPLSTRHMVTIFPDLAGGGSASARRSRAAGPPVAR